MSTLSCQPRLFTALQGRQPFEFLWLPVACLPHDGPDASLAFDRDALGFKVRNDVGYGGLRWITVGPLGQPVFQADDAPFRLPQSN
jgi:hypothetical protein